MTKEEFIGVVDNYGSHRPALWDALEKTKHLGLPVLELGCGDGSTPMLKKYCKANLLELHSYESDPEWAAKYGAVHVSDWSVLAWRKEYGVALVDHKPGEHRRVAIQLLINTYIIVIHDSEPIGWNASDYQVRTLFKGFKYVRDYQPKSGPPHPWTTLLSNKI